MGNILALSFDFRSFKVCFQDIRIGNSNNREQPPSSYQSDSKNKMQVTDSILVNPCQILSEVKAEARLLMANRSSFCRFERLIR